MEVTTENTLFIDRAFPIVFTLMGAAFLIASIIMRKYALANREKCTYLTTATVIEIVSRKSDNSHIYFYPRYSYQYGGKYYYGISDVSSATRGEFHTGQQIDIMLDPDDPDNSRIVKNEKRNQSMTRAMAIIGAVMLALGLLVFFLR